MIYTREKNVLNCNMPCTNCIDKRLIDVIKESLDLNLSHFQFGFKNAYEISKFFSEDTRSYHFPALECVGNNPSIAILGITKGITQVELSLKLLSETLNNTKDISSKELASIINHTSIHAVFAGNQMRRHISYLFDKIYLWKNLKINYNASNPEKNVDEIIGVPGGITHESFYFASFIKCALLTNKGNSDAPSLKEISNLNGAKKCLERNLLPPFHLYKNMKLIITFGKTSFDIVNNLMVGDKLIIEHFNKLKIIPIFLPHPSGANTANLIKYVDNKLHLSWITTLNEARKIIENYLQ
ncbi:MAG: hypothetical protein JXA68_10580 [Ignavibacteriales bacterium]|nr:hypothetical protein [Ignavibacteriales bacterium]